MNTEITKYCAPSKNDFAPQGSIWKYISDDGECFYIQISLDEEKPIWRPASQVLEQALKGFFSSSQFMEQILYWHAHNERKSISKILDIISK